MKTPNAPELPVTVAAAISAFLAFDDGPDGLSRLTTGQRLDRLNALRDLLHELSPNTGMPVDLVRWVPLELVTPNDYNPNAVARIEMGLLLRSITSDGYTQPVVTIWDETVRGICTRCLPNDDGVSRNPDCELCHGTGGIFGKFIIVDGFHRYFVMKSNTELRERCGGRLPIVVIDKDINERMASTVRHNRARGKHSVNGMANMVFAMLDNGMADEDVCNELGMQPEELLRLKHVTGFSKLFADTEYSRAWVVRNQIRLKAAQAAKAKTVPVPCSRDTNGDGDCGRPDCPECGITPAAQQMREHLAAKSQPGHFDCPTCGPRIAVDEDGCCRTCGADAVVVMACGKPFDLNPGLICELPVGHEGHHATLPVAPSEVASGGS